MSNRLPSVKFNVISPSDCPFGSGRVVGLPSTVPSLFFVGSPTVVVGVAVGDTIVLSVAALLPVDTTSVGIASVILSGFAPFATKYGL